MIYNLLPERQHALWFVRGPFVFWIQASRQRGSVGFGHEMFHAPHCDTFVELVWIARLFGAFENVRDRRWISRVEYGRLRLYLNVLLISGIFHCDFFWIVYWSIVLAINVVVQHRKASFINREPDPDRMTTAIWWLARRKLILRQRWMRFFRLKFSRTRQPSSTARIFIPVTLWRLEWRWFLLPGWCFNQL